MLQRNFKIADRYVLNYKIYQSVRASIYAATDSKTKTPIAIKIEDGNVSKDYFNTLDKEYQMLKLLSGVQGIPKYYHFCIEKGYKAMVFELLGKDLETIVSVFKRLNLKTVIIIAIQLIRIISAVHEKGIIHRDIKPSNILIGFAENVNNIYLTDFGISKHYIDRKKQHIQLKGDKPFIGTLRYCSVAVHNGYELSRKDDLESFVYIIIFFLRGRLPWQNIPGDQKLKVSKVGSIKKKIMYLETFNDLPEEIGSLLTYIKALEFEERPNYELLIKTLKNLFENKSFNSSYDLDQEFNKEPINRRSSRQELNIGSAFNLDTQTPKSNNLVPERSNNNLIDPRLISNSRRKSETGMLFPFSSNIKKPRRSVQLLFDFQEPNNSQIGNSIYLIQELEEEDEWNTSEINLTTKMNMISKSQIQNWFANYLCRNKFFLMKPNTELKQTN